MGALCAFLFVACYYDCKYRRIPNLLLILMLAAGILEECLQNGVAGLPFFLGGILLIPLLLYPFFKLGALGAGDIKLFGVCSGFLAYDKLLLFLFYSFLFAGIFSLIKIVIDRNAKERIAYLWDYLTDVARTGEWKLYLDNRRDCLCAGIPLAAPILCSVLLYVGGMY